MAMARDIRDVAMLCIMTVEGTLNGLEPNWTLIEYGWGHGIGIIQFTDANSFRLIRKIYELNGNSWGGAKPTAEIKSYIENNRQWGSFAFTSPQEQNFIDDFLGTANGKKAQKQLAYDYVDNECLNYMRAYDYDYSSDEEHQRMGCFACAVAVVGGAGALTYRSVVNGYNTNTLAGFYNGVNNDPIVGAANGYQNRNSTLYNLLNGRDMSKPSGINWGESGGSDPGGGTTTPQPTPNKKPSEGNSQQYENQENGVYTNGKLSEMASGWLDHISKDHYANSKMHVQATNLRQLYYTQEVPETSETEKNVNDKQNTKYSDDLTKKLNGLSNEQLSSLFAIMVRKTREDANNCLIKKYSTGADRLDTPQTADTTSYIYYVFQNTFQLSIGSNGTQMLDIAAKNNHIHFEKAEWTTNPSLVINDLIQGEILLFNDGKGKNIGAITLDNEKNETRQVALTGLFNDEESVCYPKILTIKELFDKLKEKEKELTLLSSISYFKMKEITPIPEPTQPGGGSSGGGSADVSSNIAQVKAVYGQFVYNAQCYGLTSFYVDTFNSKVHIGAGSPYGKTEVTGVGVSASDIGDDYNWAANGWAVIHNPTEIKVGDIVNIAGFSDLGYTEFGHTGVCVATGNGTTTLAEQNHSPATVSEYTYTNGYLFPQVTTVIRP